MYVEFVFRIQRAWQRAEVSEDLVEDAGAGDTGRCGANLFAQRHLAELPVRQLVQVPCAGRDIEISMRCT